MNRQFMHKGRCHDSKSSKVSLCFLIGAIILRGGELRVCFMKIQNEVCLEAYNDQVTIQRPALLFICRPVRRLCHIV